MEEEKPVGTATTQNAEEKTLTQSEVNGIVAKESKNAVEKLLRELGVEDVKSAKEGLAKFKEIQDSKKSEFDKMKENYEKMLAENNSLKQEKIERETTDTIGKVLAGLNINTKYKGTIKKLMDFSKVENRDEETLKPLVEKIISEELPMLREEEETKKVGLEKERTKVDMKNSVYLDAYKKLKRK